MDDRNEYVHTFHLDLRPDRPVRACMIRIASQVIPALHKRHTKDVLLLKPSAILSVFQLHIACAMSINKRATGVMKGKVRCKL
jgi:hypothetical protein